MKGGRKGRRVEGRDEGWKEGTQGEGTKGKGTERAEGRDRKGEGMDRKGEGRNRKGERRATTSLGKDLIASIPIIIM